MEAFFIVKLKVPVQTLPQIPAVFVLVQENMFVFDRPPEPFDEHIVQRPAPSIHADFHFLSQKRPGKCIRSELAALVRIPTKLTPLFR